MGTDTEVKQAVNSAANPLGQIIGSKGVTGISLIGLLALQMFSMYRDSTSKLEESQKDLTVKVDAMDLRLGSISTAVSTQSAEFNALRETSREQWREIKDELRMLRDRGVK